MSENLNKALFDHEGLRSPEYLCSPDPRTRMFVICNPETGHSRSLSQLDQYEAVAAYKLSGAAPENVHILFDTARNLYLYAWFVYRFYNMAEQQVFACLEMALRERLKEELPLPEPFWSKRRKKQPPSIKPMLR